MYVYVFKIVLNITWNFTELQSKNKFAGGILDANILNLLVFSMNSIIDIQGFHITYIYNFKKIIKECQCNHRKYLIYLFLSCGMYMY